MTRLLERKIDLLGTAEDTATLLDELAMLYAERLDRPQAARATYTRVLELDPDHRAGLRFVGQDALQCGDRVTARQSFARLLELGPPDGVSPERQRTELLDIHRALAQIALSESEIGAVESHLAAVLELEPADGESLELLDELYWGNDSGRSWPRSCAVAPNVSPMRPPQRSSSFGCL